MHEKDKIAIVGFGPSREKCPFDDDTFEIWGMNEIYEKVPRLDILFELHDKRHMVESFRNTSHWEWLQSSPIPIYMVKRFDDIPASVLYPFHEIVAEFGTYLTCQISEMVALAIYLNKKEIHLYGIDLFKGRGFGTEYTKQKASVEYFLGLAVGRGIKVYIPRESTLLKCSHVYGLEGADEYRAMLARLWSKHEAAAKEKEKEIKKQEALLNQSLGAMEVLEALQNIEVE